jgi:hypothetical protein
MCIEKIAYIVTTHFNKLVIGDLFIKHLKVIGEKYEKQDTLLISFIAGFFMASLEARLQNETAIIDFVSVHSINPPCPYKYTYYVSVNFCVIGENIIVIKITRKILQSL